MQAAIVEFVGQAAFQLLKEKGLMAVAMAVIALPAVMAPPPPPPPLPSPEEEDDDDEGEALGITVASPSGLFGRSKQVGEVDFHIVAFDKVKRASYNDKGDGDDDEEEFNWGIA